MGYEVLYLAMGKESMHIRENGFKYVLLNPRQKKRNIKSLGAHVRHFYLYQQVVNRKIEKRILEERPCVCLTENLLLSVNFLKYGVPLIFFENILVHRFSAKVPLHFRACIIQQSGIRGYLTLVHGCCRIKISSQEATAFFYMVFTSEIIKIRSIKSWIYTGKSESWGADTIWQNIAIV